MRTDRNDPRIIIVRYGCKCHKCGKAINKGDFAYYYPRTKDLFCECGKTDFDNFVLSAIDEENYNSTQM